VPPLPPKQVLRFSSFIPCQSLEVVPPSALYAGGGFYPRCAYYLPRVSICLWRTALLFL
jgi:hypothetical protein